MKILSEPVWISHRGVSHKFDENSYAAFQAACDAGFSWLETDLHCTRDNHIVLSHDEELGKVSLATGNISAWTRVDLEQIRLKRGGEFLFLDDFMAEFSRQHWVFDIKPSTAEQTMVVIGRLLRKNPDLIRKIIFLFWDELVQKAFLDEFPEAVCFPREAECYRAGITAFLGMAFLGNIRKEKIYSVMPCEYGLKLLSERVVRCFHKRGAKVLGYLPVDQRQVRLCLDAGVDYILSNDLPVR